MIIYLLILTTNLFNVVVSSLIYKEDVHA